MCAHGLRSTARASVLVGASGSVRPLDWPAAGCSAANGPGCHGRTWNWSRHAEEFVGVRPVRCAPGSSHLALLAFLSAAGISLKTQFLYALVFVCRYLDLFWNFSSMYNWSDDRRREARSLACQRPTHLAAVSPVRCSFPPSLPG